MSWDTVDEIEDTQIECIFVHEANDAPQDILKVDTDRDLFNNGMFENSQNIDILRYLTHAYSLQVTYVIFILCFRLSPQVTHASWNSVKNISIVGRVLAAWETAVPAMSPEKDNVSREISQNQITELVEIRIGSCTLSKAAYGSLDKSLSSSRVRCFFLTFQCKHSAKESNQSVIWSWRHGLR